MSDLEVSNIIDSFMGAGDAATARDVIEALRQEFSPTWEGITFDKPDFGIVDDGGLHLDVEKLGGGDIRAWIGGQPVTLDCTTGSGAGGKARVALVPGVDANTPSQNYVYITAAGSVASLGVSTSLPTGPFCWIGIIVIPDATTWATTGAYRIQRFSDSLVVDDRGLFSNERERIRNIGTEYISGIGQTLSIVSNPAAPDTVHLETTAGSVYQLHRQSFPAFNTGPYLLGNGASVYQQISDLSEALELSDGTAINNPQRFNLVIWGAVNATTGDCKLFVNLPNGAYGNTSQALEDRNNTADYTVPTSMKGVAFLICRVCLRYSNTNGGTWEELGRFNLLGKPVGVRNQDSSAVASNEYLDSLFRLVKSADDTARAAFDADAISAGETRTFALPDKNGTLATLDDVSGGGGGAFTLLDSGSVTNVATVDIAIPAGYTQFYLVGQRIKGFQDGAAMLLRVSNDGGLSFETTDYQLAGYYAIANGTRSGFASANTNGIEIFDQGVGTALDEIGNFSLYIQNPLEASRKTSFAWGCDYLNPSGNMCADWGSGMRDVTETNDFIRLFMTSGNFEELSYSLFGVENTP